MSTTCLRLPRRRWLLLGVATLLACDRPLSEARPSAVLLSEEDQALEHKFRGLEGGELYVDALTEKTGVNMFDEKGRRFFSRASFIPPSGNFRGSYGADFGVPKMLRVEWRDKIEMEEDGHIKRGLPFGSFYGGTVLGNYTVPVASRIPDALLDDLRKNGGGFRLKIRLHDDGPLIGWDVVRPAGIELPPNDSEHSRSAHHHIGGDFREAEIYNGRVVRKGWYIHPKSGQKIETDF